MVVSQFNTHITLEFLKKKRENQYFGRRGLGEKEINYIFILLSHMAISNSKRL
jgi:hypothetical protein